MKARFRSLALALAFAKAATLLAMPLWLHDPVPRLLWNRSASVPTGLYLRLDRASRLGDLVAACLPIEVARLARERDYLPPSRLCPGGAAPVLKRLAAGEGNHVELSDSGITLNGHPWSAGFLRQLDRQGRPMAQLAVFPLDMPAGTVFLLGEDPASFDSRYFGPIAESSLLAAYRPLFLLPR